MPSRRSGLVLCLGLKGLAFRGGSHGLGCPSLFQRDFLPEVAVMLRLPGRPCTPGPSPRKCIALNWMKPAQASRTRQGWPTFLGPRGQAPLKESDGLFMTKRLSQVVKGRIEAGATRRDGVQAGPSQLRLFDPTVARNFPERQQATHGAQRQNCAEIESRPSRGLWPSCRLDIDRMNILQASLKRCAAPSRIGGDAGPFAHRRQPVHRDQTCPLIRAS